MKDNPLFEVEKLLDEWCTQHKDHSRKFLMLSRHGYDRFVTHEMSKHFIDTEEETICGVPYIINTDPLAPQFEVKDGWRHH